MHRAHHLHKVVAKSYNVKRTILKFSRPRGRNSKTFSVFVELHGETFNHFLLTKFKAKKQNSNDPHKKVKSEPEMCFF